MSIPKKKERPKLIKCFFVFKPHDKNGKKFIITNRYQPPPSISEIDDFDEIDENSLALFCLPNGAEIYDCPQKPQFFTFLITKQNGTRIYGSTLVIWELVEASVTSTVDSSLPLTQYCNKALCLLTPTPVVVSMRKLLHYIASGAAKLSLLENICSVRVPARGHFLKLVLPRPRSNSAFELEMPRIESTMYVYRSTSEFPLLDYPLRELFTQILEPEQFMKAFLAAMLELQILIISDNYYNLMLLSEALTCLLRPFNWHHVYVPILPWKLGLHYLEAPTSYIMGIHRSYEADVALKNFMSTFKPYTMQCRIDCDMKTVEFVGRSLQDEAPKLPFFLEDLCLTIENILTIASRSQFMNHGRHELDGDGFISRKNLINDDVSYLDDMKINQNIQFAFDRCIRKHILNGHERFIVKKDCISFDKAVFLSDKSDSVRGFLERFYETQMFVSFIDESVNRARKTQKNNQNSSMQSLNLINDGSESDDGVDIDFSKNKLLESRFATAHEIQFTEIVSEKNSSADSGFPSNGSYLASPIRTRRAISKPRDLIDGLSKQRETTSAPSTPQRLQGALAAQANWRAVNEMSNEVRDCTKKILVAKITSESHGHAESMEENGLIGHLCDIIEKIWNHARSNETQNIKCPFWAHLTAFLIASNEAGSTQIDQSTVLPPAMSRMTLEPTNLVANLLISKKTAPEKYYTRPMPDLLIYDYHSVQSMKDVKTDIGKTRAFIRLALERKLLSKHLRLLLSNNDLLVQMYKRCAFLRCEEDRDQFLAHLLTLNAVDLLCFTNTFTSCTLTYTLVIVSDDSITGSFSMCGSLGQTVVYSIKAACKIMSLKHTNLGVLNALLLSVNTKNFIEMVFVINEITGAVYKFPCNRFFGRSADDGASERLLIGEPLVNCSVGDVLKKRQPKRSSSIGRNFSRQSELGFNESLTADELKQLLINSVSEIKRFYYRNHHHHHHITNCDENRTSILRHPNSRNKSATLSKTTVARNSNSRQSAITASDCDDCNLHASLQAKSLVTLFFGERQFTWILQAVFYYGFKKRSPLFFKPVFLWDYLREISNFLRKNDVTKQAASRYQTLLDSIQEQATDWGKDGKFQLFLVVSIRDHLLQSFLELLILPNLVQQYYESHSFLRDPRLHQFLYVILENLDDVQPKFDPFILKKL